MRPADGVAEVHDVAVGDVEPWIGRTSELRMVMWCGAARPE